MRLLREHRPDQTIVLADASRPLAEQLEPSTIAAADAIVIGGGPGYQRSMQPRVYPLAPRTALRAPVVPLALGSYVFPGSRRALESFDLGETTTGFLRWVSERTPHLGARDEVTRALLQRHGFGNVIMTGDPAWYDLDRLHVDPQPAADIRAVAFTPPANALLQSHGLRLLRALAAATSQVRVVQHREPQPAFTTAAASVGGDVVDISGSADGFRVFDQLDAHVGYRVHAHLYCLSRGIPSYLVVEDSRGLGALDALGPLGINPLRAGTAALALRAAAFVARRPWPGARPVGWTAARAWYEDSARGVLDQIDADVRSGWERLREARERIRGTYPAMVRMIESLPGG